MGDVVLATPVFDLIKQRWPDAHVAIGYQSKGQELTLPLCPQIDGAVHVLPGAVKHWRRALGALFDHRRKMHGYDVVLFLYKNRVSWPMRLAARLAGARVLHRHDYHFRDHRRSPYSAFPESVFFQLVTSDLLKIPLGELIQPRLHVRDEDRRAAQTYLEGLQPGPKVFLNTLGSSTIPDWPLTRYAELANALASNGVVVIFNGGSGAQRAQYEYLKPRLDPRVELLAGFRPGPLAALIDACDLFIGAHSGPVYLAHTVGTPAVTVGGPGENKYPGQGRAGPMWWPGDRVGTSLCKVIQCQLESGPGCHCLYPPRRGGKVRRVLKTLRIWKPLKRVMKRTGLYKSTGPRMPKSTPCLEMIEVDEVVAAVLENIDQRAREAAR